MREDREPEVDEYLGHDGYKLWGEERKEKDERLQAERD